MRKKRKKLDRTNSYKWLSGYNARLRRRRLAKLVLVVSAVLIALTAVVTVNLSTGLRMPRNTELSLIRQQDDTMRLVWPSIRGANAYDVKVTGDEGDLFEGRVRTPQCIMPAVSSGKLRLQIRPVRENARLGNATIREGNTFYTSCEVHWPQLTSFRAVSEEDGNSVSFIWSGQGGNSYLLFRIDEEGTYERVAQSGSSKQTLLFGDRGDYPLPDYGETYTFVGSCGYKDGHVTFCDTVSAPEVFERSDFAGDVILLECSKASADENDNLYTFTWNESKGDCYELQYQSDYVTEWTAIRQFAPDAGNHCSVRLRSGTNYRLRMVSIDKDAKSEGEYAAQSQEIALTTGISVTYATIWPQKSLTVYSDVNKKSVIGTATAAAAYTVLEESEGMFRIHIPEGYGYVDSTFCMINLPDYLGELCYYDITNSYSSIFRVHGYDMPDMTGTVIPGFEDVRVAESGPDEFLVPLLYPSAKKLLVAARSTLENGLRLKIYEAYRPYEASSYMYRTAEKHLYDPLPEMTASSRLSNAEVVAAIKAATQSVSALAPANAEESGLLAFLELENTLEGFGPETAPAEATPAPSGEEAPAAEQTAPAPEAAASTPQPTATPAVRTEGTYYSLMTGSGKYRLGSFLARSGSTHNLGIAVDITLIDSTGSELHMQTEMHDLSYYSTTDHNQAQANLLRSYMTEAGFNTLVTEWWHFQDDKTRYGKGVTTFQNKGVSPEGWVKDDEGWKYRKEDGSYVQDGSALIDGQLYTFDAAGYTSVSW